jgi:ketosteroid isomerase-like protein
MVTTWDDKAAIRALEDRFVAAFNAGDIDAMMENYVPDNSADFFSHFKGTPKLAITDLGITADGNVGFSYSFQHVTGIDPQGHPVDRTVRVTDGYRKIGGKWLIVLEHISVPVDLKTGKPALTPKP